MTNVENRSRIKVRSYKSTSLIVMFQPLGNVSIGSISPSEIRQGGLFMETRLREIKAKKFPDISIRIIPGHFATRHSHINYYIDLTSVISHHKKAFATGKALASQYASSTVVDTIVCLDGGEVVAAFMADALSSSDRHAVNAGSDIAIVTPETNSAGQLILRDNTQNLIWGKNVILLTTQVSTGKTLEQAIEYIRYYGGKVSGICALFSAVDKVEDYAINSIFTSSDLPGYETHIMTQCPDCAAGRKIDALVNNYGYSKL